MDEAAISLPVITLYISTCYFFFFQPAFKLEKNICIWSPNSIYHSSLIYPLFKISLYFYAKSREKLFFSDRFHYACLSESFWTYLFVKAETAKILNTPIPVYIFKKLFHT